MHATESTCAYLTVATQAGVRILLLKMFGKTDATRKISEDQASKQLLKENIVPYWVSTKFNQPLDFSVQTLRRKSWWTLGFHNVRGATVCKSVVQHLLLNPCLSSLCRLWVDIILGSTFFLENENPGDVRLVRTCCKALAKGGDDKNRQINLLQIMCRIKVSKGNC